jgi:hypothetical protein
LSLSDEYQPGRFDFCLLGLEHGELVRSFLKIVEKGVSSAALIIIMRCADRYLVCGSPRPLGGDRLSGLREVGE